MPVCIGAAAAARSWTAVRSVVCRVEIHNVVELFRSDSHGIGGSAFGVGATFGDEGMTRLGIDANIVQIRALWRDRCIERDHVHHLVCCEADLDQLRPATTTASVLG